MLVLKGLNQTQPRLVQVGRLPDETITTLVVNMIVRDMQPFSICEDLGFRALIQQAWPYYTIPCRQTFTTRCEDLFFERREMLKRELSHADFVSLTCDGYTQKHTQRHFDALTCHFRPDPSEPRLVSRALDMQEFKGDHHTALAIKASQKAILEFFGIESKLKCLELVKFT